MTTYRCRVERSLLWEITGSLVAAGNDLRVGNQLLFSKSKIIIKQTVFNRTHTKDPRPTSSIQRWEGLQASLVSTTSPKSLVCHPPSSSNATWVPAPANYLKAKGQPAPIPISPPNCIVHRSSPPVHYRSNTTAHLVHKNGLAGH